MNLDKNKKLLIILSMLLAFGVALMGLYSKYYPHQSKGLSLLFILVFWVASFCVFLFIIQPTQLKVKQEVKKNIDLGMNEDEAYKKVIKQLPVFLHYLFQITRKLERKKHEIIEYNIKNNDTLGILIIWLIPVSVGSSPQADSLMDQTSPLFLIWVIWLFLGWLPPYVYFKYKKHKKP